MPADRLGGDDLVQLVAEPAIQAQDEPGAHLRVFEHGAVHTTHRGGDDVVEILLPAAVSLHRIEAQLDAGDVALAIRPADDLVHAALDRDRTRLDQLSPVEQLQIGVERTAPSDRDQVAKRPVILGRQADPWAWAMPHMTAGVTAAPRWT